MEMVNAAERLWLLERTNGDAQTAGRNACRFAGALAILSRGAIHIIFIR